MRRFLPLLLVLPLLAGACDDDTTEDTPDPPATTLPAGTGDDPFGVGDLAAAAGKSAVWVQGYVAGAEADAKDNKGALGAPTTTTEGAKPVFSDVKINGQTVAFE